MPGIKTHCVQAALSSALLYPFAGGANAAAFGLTVVLIDIDHVIEYVRQTGSPKIWGVFPCCDIIHTNLRTGFFVFNAFHTLEVLLLSALLGLLHPVFFFITAGALWHCALDLFMLVRAKKTFRRALSLADYVIRARNPDNIIRFHDLLDRKDMLIPETGRDYSSWIQHWRRCRPLC